MNTQELLLTLGVSVDWEFVPASKATPDCINWIATLSPCNPSHGPAPQSFTFTQGIGHLPGYKHGRKTIADDKAEKHSIETGYLHTPSAGGFPKPGRKLQPPTAQDLLYCLCMDSEALDMAFEDWAAEYGYDDDSRAAEATWGACCESGRKLIKLVGRVGFERLCECAQAEESGEGWAA